MKKEKIAFAVQRYGTEVNGGAEYLCRALAEHMTVNYEVTVFTTCAKSYCPWDNYYRAGMEVINQVNVWRYPVEKIRDEQLFQRLSTEMKNSNKELEDAFIDELGPYSPLLIEDLKIKAGGFQAVIFVTYLYYTTIKGLQLNLKNAILMPTAHDEPQIYWNLYKNIFQMPAAMLYNSVEEMKFLQEKFHVNDLKYRLTCAGIDMPDINTWQQEGRYQEFTNYIIYVGRISNGKNFCELNKYFMEYKKKNKSDLKLLAVGRADNNMRLICSDDIIYTGFVSEQEKIQLMAHAKLLVLPSLYESLSLVILESMALRRPILVNGRCAVLKGQCERSNAGLYYTDYYEFELSLNYILSHKQEYNEMCENGYRFVKQNYNWDSVVANISSLIEEL